MRRKWRIVLIALGLALLSGSMWIAFQPRDRLFRGKPESAWITNIAYGVTLSEAESKEQVRRWRDLGPEGLLVLERGLKPPPGRTYQKFYRRVSTWLPAGLVRLLPSPGPVITGGSRLTVLNLLCRMGTNAHSTWPAVARCLADDDASIRQMAINFFTQPENEKAFLNQMSAPDKKKLLPLFVRSLEDSGPNWGARNNAALALKYYPEHAPLVAPALAKALADPVPFVRLMAAEALNRVDGDAANKARAVTVVVQVTREPNDQIAWRAVSALREFQHEPEAAVPALIEALSSTNSLVGCSAVWTIESSFRKHADKFIPALRKAAERTDNVGGYARGALKGFESSPTVK